RVPRQKRRKGERNSPIVPPAEQAPGRRPPMRRRRSRPKGTTVPFERDRQRFTISALWGFRFAGAGPYTAAYWAAYVTGEEPIRPEDIEGLLIAAGTKIKHTASTLEKHLDHLARKADRIPRSGPDRADYLDALARKAART